MKTKTFGILTLGVLILSGIFITIVAQSQSVPQLINYQGRLTGSGGVPITGTGSMHFALLDGATASATVLWEETQGAVPINQGIYNVMLGAGNPIPASALSGATVYLEVRVNGETLLPRRRVTSVAYALQAEKAEDAQNLGGQPASAYLPSAHDHDTRYYTQAQVDALIANLQSQITALQAQANTNTTDIANHTTQINTHTSQISNLDGRMTTAEGNITSLDNRVTINDTDILALDSRVTANETWLTDHETRISALEGSTLGDYETRISALETKLANVSVSGTDFIFSGVNVHIRDGSGNTEGAVNGLGNLIIGYNEQRGTGDTRTGSHNLVIGSRLNYSSYGGLVAGSYNTISNTYASVSGGDHNTASGSSASVSGGRYNVASGDYSSVAGGGGLTAAAGNEAYSHYSAILGGQSNDTGNGSNRAIGQYATVGGGDTNRASGTTSSVSGGAQNTASNISSSVSCGYQNAASGQYSGVTGGETNTASARSATVSGGLSRSAGGNYDWVAGGLLEGQ